MTAFLTINVLRAHLAPLRLRDSLRRADAPRPALSTRWQIAPDGRLTCRWQADDPAPERPPL
jgi:hypothetical protein